MHTHIQHWQYDTVLPIDRCGGACDCGLYAGLTEVGLLQYTAASWAGMLPGERALAFSVVSRSCVAVTVTVLETQGGTHGMLPGERPGRYAAGCTSSRLHTG